MDTNQLLKIYILLLQVAQLVGVSQMELKNEIKESLGLKTFANLNIKILNEIIQFLEEIKDQYK